MNAGFVTKKREEELWETQRIITQLKVSFDSCATLSHEEKINDWLINFSEKIANV